MMPERQHQKNKSPSLGFGLSLALVSFLCFVVWTELHPRGVACGGISTMCSSSVRNISMGLEMFAQDHDGQYPDSLQKLVPGYLLEIPECSGGFNGCRPITLFGIRSMLASLGQDRPGPSAVPTYTRYLDKKDQQQYSLICQRKHHGQKRYHSEGDRFQAVWDGKLKEY